jgi:hypothetical protein
MRARSWLRQLCQRLWRENGTEPESVLTGVPVRLIDATLVREQGETGGQWRIHCSVRFHPVELLRPLLTSPLLCRRIATPVVRCEQGLLSSRRPAGSTPQRSE